MPAMHRSGAHTRRGPIGWLTRKDFLAPILVLTVLVCHGAYGAMHQVMPEAVHAGMGPAHAAPTGEGPHSGVSTHGHGYHAAHEGVLDCLTALLFPMDAHPQGDATADGPTGTLNHIAALLLLTSATAWLLAFAAKGGIGPATRPQTVRRILAPGSLRLPPGPSLARLQVLRL
jgi:hypothetical protein